MRTPLTRTTVVRTADSDSGAQQVFWWVVALLLAASAGAMAIPLDLFLHLGAFLQSQACGRHGLLRWPARGARERQLKTGARGSGRVSLLGLPYILPP
jgi:hypothetical protein